ncbi:hypothetical protein [uncultured Desulfobacter sp.]|uniref:hypothetical protein n=1 Tax=uncultured Desulfobacter sp. TaxID=240139 RepID=UPI002AA6EABA|nr:hypothetical protein [uncultured Desulfobacter sp.]
MLLDLNLPRPDGLTQTLLWLGQDEQVQLPVSDMDLEQLVLELAEEANYLLRDKDV